MITTQIHPDVPRPQLATPNEHMQQLAWFIGDWQVKSRYLTDAQNETWAEDTLRAIHTYEMGGHVIFEHVLGTLTGEAFEGWSLRKFNPNTEKWEQRWVDSTPNGFFNWIGRRTDDGFMGFAQIAVNDDLTLKGERATREIFHNITQDSFDWRLETTQDSGATWRTTWTLEYRRG